MQPLPVSGKRIGRDHRHDHIDQNPNQHAQDGNPKGTEKLGILHGKFIRA